MNEKIEGILEKLKVEEPLTEAEYKVVVHAMKIMQTVLYEKIADTPFISGHGGEIREGDQMPEYFHICPTFGCDFSVAYKRVDME